MVPGHFVEHVLFREHILVWCLVSKENKVKIEQ